jgi:hypothetical protein
MKNIITRISTEPSLVTGVVLAVIGLAAAFGLGLTDGQQSAIVAVVASVLALAGSVVTRQQVAPMTKVAVLRDPRTGRYVTAKAHPGKDGTPVDLDPAA